MKFNIRVVGVILLAILALLLGYTINRNYELTSNISIKEQNIKALNDSVRVEKNKVGQLEYSKGVLIAEKGNLSSINKKLAEELEKTKGKVSEITNYDVEINPTIDGPVITKKDSVYKINEGEYVINWNFDTIYNKNNWRYLDGTTTFIVKSGETIEIHPKFSQINNEKNKINITQGIREKDGLIEVFVTSDHPFFKVSDIQSVIINPKDHVVNDIIKTKPKRFGIGPVLGYGFTENGSGYFIGAGVSYNIIRF